VVHLAQLPVDVVLTRPERGQCARGFEFLNHIRAEVHVFNPLHSSRDLCSDVTQLRGQAHRRIGDRELRFRGHVLRLDELLVRAKALDPETVFADTRHHLRLLALQLRDYLIELHELLADQPLALEGLAGEVLPAEFERFASTAFELAKLIPSAITVVHHALFRGDEVGHIPPHDVQLLELLVIAVVGISSGDSTRSRSRENRVLSLSDNRLNMGGGPASKNKRIRVAEERPRSREVLVRSRDGSNSLTRGAPASDSAI